MGEFICGHHKVTFYQNQRRHKDATKNFDYTTCVDRLRTVLWSNYCHPPDVVNLSTNSKSCEIERALIQNFVNNSPYRNQILTTNPSREAVFGYKYFFNKKYKDIVTSARADCATRSLNTSYGTWAIEVPRIRQIISSYNYPSAATNKAKQSLK